MQVNQFNLRFMLRNVCGRYPKIFYATYGLKSTNRKLLVNKNTQLLIEGFPRSANTFAVLTFKYANPDINIAHHLHIPSQVFQAIKWQIPTLILIRNPKDAVASWVLRNPGLSVDLALKSYASFYKLIQPYNSKYIVAKFEDVIANYFQIIEQVNAKFGSSFIAITPTTEQKQEIFTQIRELTIRSNGFDCILKSSRPSTEKNTLKELIFKDMEQKHKDSLVMAETVYNNFI
ncbi:MAG: hypothetical protein IGS23_01920 [Rivularia sp. T60_A2020_040]|nr:hypothetical protein [Rivularia sp. T60_A2020_040]